MGVKGATGAGNGPVGGKKAIGVEGVGGGAVEGMVDIVGTALGEVGVVTGGGSEGGTAGNVPSCRYSSYCACMRSI